MPLQLELIQFLVQFFVYISALYLFIHLFLFISFIYFIWTLSVVLSSYLLHLFFLLIPSATPFIFRLFCFYLLILPNPSSSTPSSSFFLRLLLLNLLPLRQFLFYSTSSCYWSSFLFFFCPKYLFLNLCFLILVSLHQYSFSCSSTLSSTLFFFKHSFLNIIFFFTHSFLNILFLLPVFIPQSFFFLHALLTLYYFLQAYLPLSSFWALHPPYYFFLQSFFSFKHSFLNLLPIKHSFSISSIPSSIFFFFFERSFLNLLSSFLSCFNDSFSTSRIPSSIFFSPSITPFSIFFLKAPFLYQILLPHSFFNKTFLCFDFFSSYSIFFIKHPFLDLLPRSSHYPFAYSFLFLSFPFISRPPFTPSFMLQCSQSFLLLHCLKKKSSLTLLSLILKMLQQGRFSSPLIVPFTRLPQSLSFLVIQPVTTENHLKWIQTLDIK